MSKPHPTTDPKYIAEIEESLGKYTKRFKLLAPAIVISEFFDSKPVWRPQALGVGSIVAVFRTERWVSPLTLDQSEHYVIWTDVIGRQTRGWLARTTPMKEVRSTSSLYNDRNDLLPVSAFDLLRERVSQRHSTLLAYVARFGHAKLPWLKSIIRELGGKLKPADDTDAIIRKALRLILNREVPMSEIKEARDSAATKTKVKVKTTPNEKPKAKATKKTAVTATAAPRSMARTTGNAVLPLLVKAGAKTGKTVAKKLIAGEDVSKKDLTSLRDAVNVAASTARDGGNGKLASQLSAANRLVRRLVRKA